MPRAERERLILDFAGHVFARSGYHSTSMDEIARLAGVSKPLLYAYFDSKEGLYVAYIDRTGRELLDRLEMAPGRGDSVGAGLRARIAEFLAFVAEHREGWIVLFRETSSSGSVAQEVAQLRDQIAQAVGRMLDVGAATAGELSPLASDALAHAIVGAGESLANWWLLHADVPREDVAEWYVGLVQAAVAAALRR